ncbi:probable FAT1 - Long-chain fatty acid transporter [Melanopsichium pennsylvanicum]|uniref:Very long-chain fatty acid transport protein n=2 Tax=Melanopsichium pennsylvanicum TaxID=63383 RepID=A0AAJ4XLF0_9BASI|nr:probable FAT1-Long-chain fatty acid transporter [Melanopsichium pennsylvanicum 4]SNX84288.1 probable FAT1 - Long-chain fatty acid transporter [Melanopsichium pennsylvanicum]
MAAIAKAAASLAAIAYIDAKHGLANDLHLGRGASGGEIGHKIRSFRNKLSLYEYFDAQATKRPNAIAYVYLGKSFTWGEVAKDVHRLANYLLSRGLKPGDRVALFMGNSVAILQWYYACMCINIVPAFINNSLTEKGLVHCVSVARAKLLVYEPYLEGPVSDVQDELLANSPLENFLCYNDGITPLDGDAEKAPSAVSKPLAKKIDFGSSDLLKYSAKRISDKYRKDITESSTAALIYTSGTTGLPKAALCSHGRMGTGASVWPILNGFSTKDRIYTPMPLYHSSALFLCICASLCSGSTVIIGRKFSARKYWDEVRKYDATVVQYIGEIARYLLAVPPSPMDKQHKVRMAYGNGMRPDVWAKFRERYGVRIISEFFASSEGNGALLNYNTGPFGAGAVGRMGTLSSKLKPDFKIIRVDAITEDIYRDPKTGMCVECLPNEPGEFVMRIGNSSISKFQGYADNPEATSKKILSNALKKGDAWFRSGDLMSKDQDGFFYFGDRMGDTFRWRSENVSTTEVSNALGQVVGEANVYGVLVPKHDGRAGCAAIPAECTVGLDWKQLAQVARKSLPKYAVPLFIRVVPTMEQTGTVKQQKVQLRNQGIEHAKCGSDRLYWLPPYADAYEPFLPEHYQSIEAGKLRL